MKKTAIAILLMIFAFTVEVHASTKLGIYQKNAYGKYPGELPKFLSASDEAKHLPFNFNVRETRLMYADALGVQYGTGRLSDEEVDQHISSWKKVSLPKDKDQWFYENYRVWYVDSASHKISYFQRKPHRAGDDDGCTKDEEFYLNQTTGILESSDFCGNMTLCVNPPAPEKPAPPPPAPTPRKVDSVPVLTMVGQAPTGQSVYSYSSNVNNNNPNFNMNVYNVITGGTPAQTAPAPAPREVVYVDRPNQNQEITVRNRPNALDWINTGLNAANTVFGGINTFRGVKFANSPAQTRTVVYRGGQRYQGNTGGYYYNNGGNSNGYYNYPQSAGLPYSPNDPTDGYNLLTNGAGQRIPWNENYMWPSNNGGYGTTNNSGSTYYSTNTNKGCPAGYYRDLDGNCVQGLLSGN